MTIFSIEQMIRDHLEPRVPAELMRYTCGTDTPLDFVRSGAEVFTMLDLAAKKYGGRPLSGFKSTLDFGCGNGRILRFFTPPLSGSLRGCDVNGPVVDFVFSHFPFVDAYHSPLMPPLKYADGTFDLIYSFSVFSHLSLAVEKDWLRELKRVSAPGCLFLLSIHGDWMIEQTLGDRADAVRKTGFTWDVVHGRFGTWSDFPDYYEASFHTSDYVRANWSEYFEILDVIKGDDAMRYVAHNPDLAYVARQVRPMGQDLVVARKR
jgi:SAM-dependent methyltransferase